MHDVISINRITDDAVRTMRIIGRSCMSFYARQTKIRCVRFVRCGPVDAYLYITFFSVTLTIQYFFTIIFFELREPPSQHLLKMLRGGAKHMSSVLLRVVCVFLCCISVA
ncbi:hypothetical protein SFRURICE_014604 [Spodoptera frugiperda]|uniref:SFRICE_012794 n=1 Tax=Spodoptera frugiperda TaxID=7108 RepID=A0A2H1VRJ8_SPOFR|nr:hypothetical protein SFRURICE_014604 [Spodoptera frugiperda]